MLSLLLGFAWTFVFPHEKCGFRKSTGLPFILLVQPVLDKHRRNLGFCSNHLPPKQRADNLYLWLLMRPRWDAPAINCSTRLCELSGRKPACSPCSEHDAKAMKNGTQFNSVQQISRKTQLMTLCAHFQSPLAICDIGDIPAMSQQ